MPILLSDEELGALEGLTHLQYRLYISGIRRHMDYQTGITGLKRKISYKSLSEEAYVETHQGIDESGAPSKDQVRRAVKSLERAGLISIKSGAKQLILECILAKRDNYVQNKPATNPPPQTATQAATLKTAKTSGNIHWRHEKAATQAAIPKNTKAATHPVSGIYIDDNNGAPVDNYRKLLIEQGYYQHMWRGDTIEMLQAWAKDGISADEARIAIQRGNEAKPPRPSTPSYYRNIPYQIREEFKQAQDKAEVTKHEKVPRHSRFSKTKSKTEMFYDNVLPGFKDYIDER